MFTPTACNDIFSQIQSQIGGTSPDLNDIFNNDKGLSNMVSGFLQNSRHEVVTIGSIKDYLKKYKLSVYDFKNITNQLRKEALDLLPIRLDRNVNQDDKITIIFENFADIDMIIIINHLSTKNKILNLESYEIIEKLERI